MREIKFRAWDIDQKKWLPTDNFRVAVDMEGNIWQRLKRKLQWVGCGSWCKLQQYTGLKDKNGKEIYEGDIVKGWNNQIAEVVFDDSIMEDGTGAKMGSGFMPTEDFPLSDSEVIGNIYENPELLESK